MNTYDKIETDQDGIDLANLIRTIWHLQDDVKKDIISAVETNKQLYLFDQNPYQSNENYLEHFKAHIKVSRSHNVAVGYYSGSAAVALQ